MSLDPLKIDSYDYTLPKELIASTPVEPKDSCKLLIYDRKKDVIIHETFYNILKYIPKDTVILLNNTKVRMVKFIRDGKILDFVLLNNILNDIGHVPLPPYIKRNDTKEDEKNYQSLFAKNMGAVAAPTASLHFTENLFNKLESDYDTKYLTLHVGAGTFKPVNVSNILEHKMHSELYEIPGEKKILSIGTTVARTIEYYIKKRKSIGAADIFIHPLSPPTRVDYLLTNFHLPKSTLLMLVSSFIGIEKTMEIYNIAIKNKYRFFSYGDAMLII